MSPKEKVELDLIISVGESKELVLENIKNIKIKKNVQKAFEISKAQIEAQSRYLRIKGKRYRTISKNRSYIIFDNPSKKLN